MASGKTPVTSNTLLLNFFSSFRKTGLLDMSHHGGRLFNIQPTFVPYGLPRPLSPDASTNEYGLSVFRDLNMG